MSHLKTAIRSSEKHGTYDRNTATIFQEYLRQLLASCTLSLANVEQTTSAKNWSKTIVRSNLSFGTEQNTNNYELVKV